MAGWLWMDAVDMDECRDRSIDRWIVAISRIYEQGTTPIVLVKPVEHCNHCDS